MKQFAAVIALAAMTLTVRAAEPSQPPPSVIVTPGSTYLGGSSDTLPGLSLKVPPLNKALIHSGRHGTIRYFNGPAFSWPLVSSISLDLNADGTDDFIFNGYAVTTASIPGNTWLSYNFQGVGSNQFLASSNLVTAWTYGMSISPSNAVGGFPPFGPYWSWISDDANAATFSSGADSSWSGPLAQTGIGYIAVRFQAPDGLHYGWIRVRLPTAPLMGISSGQPAVLDWAYEKRPDMPIRTGAVSSARGIKEFVVFLRDPGGLTQSTNLLNRGRGRAFLIGNILRYEMRLPGTFSNATFRPVSTGMPFNRLIPSVRADSPRINIHRSCPSQQDSNGLPPCETEFTVFFGDVKLSSLQLGMLRRRQFGVDVGNGTATGEFVNVIEAPRLLPSTNTNLPPILPPTELPGDYPGGSPIPPRVIPVGPIPQIEEGSGVQMQWRSGDPASASQWLSTLPVEGVVPAAYIPANP